ncbi:DUF736 family protein [Rhizobium sp. Leaf391]|uniref:DUF736 family protein n=1 Tax=Rhizobium sp. Leaf391 TaxID=1736360 RepID=UPI00244EC409|nr:DUF736 family protein [Rhizobium sp. Leaf391]
MQNRSALRCCDPFGAAGLSGNIVSMANDIDLTDEEISSTNPNAPVYRILAKTPRGRSVKIGGIWKKIHQNGGGY